LRATLIAKHSKIAAEQIATLNKPTVEHIAQVIANEFEAAPL
jgi:hypothetical protein